MRAVGSVLTNKALLLASVLVNTDRPMSDEPPTPPADLPTDVVDTLDDYSPGLLRHVARYAEELVEYREREARPAEADDEDERPDDLPDDVPSKATIKESTTTATTTGNGEKAIR